MVVTAVRDLRITKGSAGSHVFECDDGRNYFVKFNDGTRTVVNEYVGYSFARHLDLPVPENGLVHVTSELIEGSEDLQNRGVEEGIHHGTIWMENCVDFMNVVVREMALDNAEVLPGIVILDNLLLNVDRNNPGNNLLQTTATGLEYKTVDFSEILSGRNWTVDTVGLAAATSYLMPVFPVVALEVRGLESFSPWLETCEGLSEAWVSQMLSSVPPSWGLSEKERAAISDFVLARRTMVRGALLKNKTRFLNWK